MEVRRYLPSAQFTVLVAAVALSAGLVWAADRFAHPPRYAAGVAAGGIMPVDDSVWRGELLSLAGSTTPPQAPGDIASLLKAAQTQNLTESVGRSLLLNLSAAQAQNMANDEGAQQNILAQALAQAGGSLPDKRYAASDLNATADSAASLHAWGNGVMAAVGAHAYASYGDTELAMGLLVDNSDAAQATKLKRAAADYRALAADIARLPVPQSFVPLALSLLNNTLGSAAACDDMAATLSDPLRGLSGFQSYQQYVAANLDVYTSVENAFAGNGILFTKDEPGNAWSLFHTTSS